MPKSSSEAQYLEGRQNLLKLMKSLTDDEQAAVENDIQAVDKLLNKLTGSQPRK
jgi:Trp operon repressor